MSDTARTAVETILSESGISFFAEYRGLKKNAFGQKGHHMDEWRCIFTHSSRPNEPEEFEFFTGLGLRGPAPAVIGAPYRPGTIAHEQWQAQRKPVAPCAADVLHCIVLDSYAAEQTFESWCDEYGYDTDSRKAFATYEACQQETDKLRRVFTRKQIESIGEALQDY